MDEEKIAAITRIICLTIVSFILLFVVYKNYPLFGEDVILSGSEVSNLSPDDRVINFPKPSTQLSDIIYFDTKSEGYDSAKVTITYKTENPEQELHIGYKDEPTWHYKTLPVYLPFIEKLDWNKIEDAPTLYQRNSKYTYVGQFLKYPPKEETVGTYYLNANHSINVLEAYSPKKTPTIIDTPLRGNHTFYTYINNEPFDMTIEKSDLNWYQGEDVLTINVYKDDVLLSQKTIDDDGITDASRTVGEKLYVKVGYENGNPENGVYKIVIRGNGDCVVTSIKSSFSRIVFEGPIYPISGQRVYDAAVAGVNPVNVFTDAKEITLRTQHNESTDDIKINGSKIAVDPSGEVHTYKTESARNEINLGAGDIIVDGHGYFAFDQDSFFTPFIYKRHEIKPSDNLEGINYLLTDYKKSFNSDDGFKVKELEFNLHDAFYNKDTLSWIIKAPKLNETGGKVYIKDIKVELHKKQILNF